MKQFPLSDAELLALRKPGQYLGAELNSVLKNDIDCDLHLALAFPDTYEIGMSHLGLQILYDIINGDSKAWAERVYMPEKDMEETLRAKGTKLFSLESQRPLNTFDIVGFSLQFELCATNILAMLELGGIPLLAAERSEDHPLIIGGGPYAFHPEAIAPFFDAFFIGDAEDAIHEIIAVVRANKGRKRADLLRALDRIEGIYVPAFFTPQYAEGRLNGIASSGSKKAVSKRLLPDLNPAPYPAKPLVPIIKAVHDRLALEVMRGCVRGCRFCQAGYIYRPQRERSPQTILRLAGEALSNSGIEDLSLLSLSTADYCSILPLLRTLMDTYGSDGQVSISFPSTRVDALKPELLEQVQRVRRTSLTIAPEAGTQRLRDAINKGVSDEQILETCSTVFSMGWKGVKMYFMIGFPTETDEDLLGIVDIARRVKELPNARGKQVTVSVSTLVPKPHTPYQWAAQISREETIRRQRIISGELRRLKITFRYHECFSSFLEGVCCRAGRELAPVIKRAYELGCRFDAWEGRAEEDKWMQAFSDCGIDAETYLRERSAAEPLPWDHLDCGIPKKWFALEYGRTTSLRVTPSCLDNACSGCAICDHKTIDNVLWPPSTEPQTESAAPPVPSAPLAAFRYRIRYTKTGVLRFVGHLELAHFFHRAARRASLPLAYSGGFHPLPKISFGPPLALGTESVDEFFDITLTEDLDARTVYDGLAKSSANGLQVLSVSRIAPATPSLQQDITGFRYRLTWDDPQCAPLPDLNGLTVERNTKDGKTHRFLLSDYISETLAGDSSFEFTLSVAGGCANPRPSEIARAVLSLDPTKCGIEKRLTYFRSYADNCA